MATADDGNRTRSVRLAELPPAPGDETSSSTVTIRVVYACPHCRRSLRLRPEYFGSNLACKHCERPFIPSLSRALSDLPARSRGPAPRVAAT